MTEPRVSRPHVPGYGIPEDTTGLLPWAWARERLDAALIYRLATADADAAPHLVPIWGAWVDDRWYVEGGPTRWQRNLRANPKLAIQIESGDEVVVVEGVARELVAPPQPLSSRILAGYAKYRPGYEASAEHWREGGLWELRPIRAFAWSVFPTDMTRYEFGVE
ncbi:MAG TPA: pyridoxamine 5'-phosphate oxidase family protein [Candidatus Limnocylindrales bacterium]|nr:pyridoxamine 5'-phosphate oxidase family protein [Candidatus Limnocylindrales bacterium]